MQKFVLLTLFVFSSQFSFAQTPTDSIQTESIEIDSLKKTEEVKFNYKALLIPTALIGYGFYSLENNNLKSWNTEIGNEIRNNGGATAIDDFTRFAPAVSVYALNAFGVKGKHNLKDRTIILGTATLLMAGSTFAVKGITKVERPDGSSNDSFPSGHTAVAFMGAEFLYQEYKDVSVWYGVAGYVVAAGTGVCRMYNNRHWFSDVVAGAGFGILSTKVAYWIYPWMKEKIFKDKTDKINGMAMPFYNGKQAGLGFVINF